MKKIIILIICIFVTVGCKTVKEVEEEKNDNVIDYGSFKKVRVLNQAGDSVWTYEGDLIDVINHIYTAEELAEQAARIRQGWNERCKDHISVFPNPTSSSATININLRDAGSFNPRVGLKYKLIFDERIIYENDNDDFKGKEEIPAHLLKNNGTYIVAYEIYRMHRNNNTSTLCAGTVNFMVTGKQ